MGSIKRMKFLEYMRTALLLRTDSAPRIEVASLKLFFVLRVTYGQCRLTAHTLGIQFI